jgi:prepilin-type N-terminal cleavage/methylation domain-containing protein
MLGKKGITLMEIIIVMIIVGIAAVINFPNYTTPMENARAETARNNLLAIYSAEKNYNFNHGGYCLGAAGTCDTLANINTTLSLNIQDDGTYTYACAGPPGACTATRTGIAAPNTLKLTLDAPVNLNGNVNPTCTLTPAWCP